ncbi:MAG: hypothetical protein HY893_06055 [Deltaproteobacteria bacterium]|nr:hypothetical protein [Deltaproteobacteria bacterium]
MSVLLVPSYGWPKTVRIAVMQWKVNSPGDMEFIKSAMADMLASRLGANQSVEVIGPESVKAALGDKVDLTEHGAIEAGKKLKADYVLYGSLTVLGSSVSLDAKLLNVKDGAVSPLYSKGAGMDSVISMTDKLATDTLAVAVAAPVAAAPIAGAVTAETLKPEIKSEPKPVPIIKAEPQEGPKDSFIIKPKEGPKPVSWRSKPFDGVYTAILSADLNKDGVKELFILSPTNLVIAKQKDDGIEVVKEIKETGGAKNVAISAIDSDRDGSMELYVSKVLNNRPYTSIIEFKDNDYKTTVTGIEWLVRTVDASNEAVLVGQKFRKGDGFYGPLTILKKEGAKVAEKGRYEIELPKKTDIYRFEVFSFSGESPELVVLDERGYIKLYKKDGKGKWEQSFKSRDYYGGTLNPIILADDRPGTTETESVPLESRFYRADFNKDGKLELIIKRNVPGGLGRYSERPGSYKDGQILSLSWDEGGEDMLRENWKTRPTEGFIEDFFINDGGAEGAREMTLLVVEGTGSLTGRPKSYILSYRVSL